MSTTTPLTDAINALTTYANETTGASDTDLSSAVATLVAGYGGGGVESGTFTPESDTQTFTCSVSTTYTHLLIIMPSELTDITTSGRTLIMGYAIDEYQYLVDTNGSSVYAFIRSGSDSRFYVTFSSTTITAGFLGNGAVCTFPSGVSYNWFAW